MTDYTWPSDLVPYAVSFYLQPHTGGSESPFSRQTKVYALSAPRWICRISFRGGYDGIEDQKAFGPRLDAIIAKLKGRQNRIEFFDWRRDEMRGGTPTGNSAALAGATSMTLTGLTPGAKIYNGDYIGGDGRPHIIADDAFGEVHATASGGGTATVTFEPPLQADIAADTAIFGNPTGLFRLTNDDAGENGVEVGDAQIMSLEFVEDPDTSGYVAALFRRPAVEFYEFSADTNAHRFGSYVPVTDTTGFVLYSSKKAGVGATERGMRLEVRSYTLNIAAQTLTMGTPVVIDEPPQWGTGFGAVWANQIIRLTDGTLIAYAQFLNSPDGTYTHADSRYDNVFYVSEDNGVTWGSMQTIITGQNAYTAFGVADQNAAGAGFHTPSGNTVVQMASGRIVLVGYLTYSNHLGCIYTDGDPTDPGSYDFGTPIVYTDGDWNEPTMGFARDGSLVITVRDEGTDSRAIFTSANGATISYLRHATDIPINNVANAIYGNESRLVIGGATNPTNGVRNQYKIYKSTDSGATVSAGGDILEPLQMGGYSYLDEIAPGYLGLLYETMNDQVEFNVSGNLHMAVFNTAFLNGSAIPAVALDSDTYVAADEYAAYAAYVTGDGGTVDDPADCLAAITAAIAGNYYSAIGAAASAKWGRKVTGGYIDLYNLNRTKWSAATTVSGATINTALETFDVLVQAADDSWVDLSAAPRAGNAMGVVIASGSRAGRITWTDDAAAHNFNNTGFVPLTVGGVTYMQTSPGFASLAAGDTSFYFVDPLSGELAHGRNGTWEQDVTGIDWKTAVGEVESIRALGFTELHELWILNDADRCGRDGVRQCAIDARDRTT